MTSFARARRSRSRGGGGTWPSRVELWDGTRRTYGAGPEEIVVRLHDRRTCLRLLANPSLRFGEAFADGAIEVQGDLGKLMEILLRLEPARHRPRPSPPDPRRGAASWLLRNSPFRARRNVAYHYDLGNEFFALWLGRTMAYSCAYFRDPADDIDTAQEQKFRHVCEKLRLEPGQTLLDIGCGWGGLAAYAATHYGVQVLGITLSEAQKRGADEMLRARGLQSRVDDPSAGLSRARARASVRSDRQHRHVRARRPRADPAVPPRDGPAPRPPAASASSTRSAAWRPRRWTPGSRRAFSRGVLPRARGDRRPHGRARPPPRRRRVPGTPLRDDAGPMERGLRALRAGGGRACTMRGS